MDTHERSDLRRRVATVLRGDALFSTMSTDFPLRQRFISNAAQALSDVTDPFSRRPFINSGTSSGIPVPSRLPSKKCRASPSPA